MLLTGAAMFALIPRAEAQTVWTGAIDSDWFKSGNWTAGVPTAGNTNKINSATNNPVTVTGVTAAQGGSFLFVGENVGVQLSVANGTLFDTNAYIGYTSGSSSATVGAGGTWNNSNELHVGRQGNGTLLVTGGGDVTSSISYIGALAGSNSSATVTGAGSTWNAGNLYVGLGGTGGLTVSSGGAVQSATSTVAENAGSSGTVLITGAGSSWTPLSSFTIGNRGVGQVTLSAGATLSAGGVFVSVGALAGSSGTLTLNDTGTTATVSDIHVADSGTGVLRVLNGADLVSNSHVRSGAGSGSNGTILVSGAGSTLSMASELNIAESTGSVGKVIIADSGSVTAPSGVWLGIGGGTASLYIGGDTTAAAAGTLIAPNVQFNGVGSLVFNHTNSAYTFSSSLTSGSSNDIVRALSGATTLTGANTSYNGNIFVDTGATLNLDSNINAAAVTVGSVGTGTLAVEAGADLISTSASTLGVNAGSHGVVNITGSGSLWNTGTATLSIGALGDGDLTVSNGGRLASSSSVFVAASAEGTGSLTVTGAGSTLGVNVLDVGLSGFGELEISNGASANIGSFAIGTNASGVGEAVIDNASVSNSQIYIGSQGRGTLDIQNGGQLTSSDGRIGNFFGATGVVNVTGSGSFWQTVSTLNVGYQGQGTLNVLNGADVLSNSTSVGFAGSPNGLLRVDGAGSTFASTVDLNVGYASLGTLVVSNDGAVSTGTLRVAVQAGSAGDIYIGGQTTATGAGTLTTGTVYFGAGTSSLNFNHTETAYSFTQILNGGGGSETLRALSGATTLTGNNTAFGGAVVVSGGATLEIAEDFFGSSGAIGSTSSGRLEITSGAQAEFNAGITVGQGVGGDGELLVSGAGTRLETTVAVGGNASGQGFARFEGGAQLTGNLQVGSNGTAEIDNATVNASGITAYSGGSITASNGAEITNTFTEISNGGAITIDGPGTTWSQTGLMRVGYASGGASLTISDGATLSSQDGHIAERFSAPTGDVLITGSGSRWDTGDLNVGHSGAGTLTIVDGGTMHATGAARVGYGGTGAVVVTGTTSLLDADGALIIADLGSSSGRLIIGGDGAAAAAGQVQASAIQFGAGTGSLEFNHTGTTSFSAGIVGGTGSASLLATSGTTTLTGDGSGFGGALNVDGGTLIVENLLDATSMTIGATQFVSSVVVQGAGALTTDSAAIGGQTGLGTGDGEITVSGAGASWTNSGAAIVGVGGTIGDTGTGRARVEDGATVETDSLVVGQAFARGAVRVTGAGSTLSSDSAIIGADGVGVLVVDEDATFSASSLVVAQNSGSSGTVHVGGDSTAGGAGTLDVGQVEFGYGAGSLIFNHTETDYVFAGDLIAGIGNSSVEALSGTTTLTGDNWHYGSDVYVWDGATLHVASALAANTFLVQGGTASISGEAIDFDTLLVFADGAFSADSGATLTGSQATIYDGALFLDGAGTTLDTSGGVGIGWGGSSSLEVTNGATIDTNSFMLGIRYGLDVGTALISGSGSKVTADFFDIGATGSGTLTIEDGAIAQGGSWSILGAGTSAVGEAMVTGSGSAWHAGDELNIGLGGNGKLVVADGGLVSATETIVAVNSGSFGEIIVGGDGAAAAAGVLDMATITFGDGDAAITFNHTDADYELGAALIGGGDGTATLNALAGSTALTGDNSAFGGDVVVDGGTLLVQSTLLANAVQVGSSGVAASSLIIEGDGVLQSTTTSIAGDWGGSLTVRGADARWEVSGIAAVGVGAAFLSGEVTVEDGAAAAVGQLIVGDGLGDGRVTVSGSGSTFTSAANAIFDTEWRLTLADGGVFSAPSIDASGGGTIVFGADLSSAAEAAGILDAASLNSTGSLGIYFNHTHTDFVFETEVSAGSISLTALGGHTTLAGDIESGYLQLHAMGARVAVEADLIATSGGQILAGLGGEAGEISIRNGAHVLSQVLYAGASADGMVDISDGALVEMSLGVAAGSDGAGEIIVRDGATLDTPLLLLGVDANGTGELRLSGVGSSITVTNQLNIGLGGEGVAIVSDGAELVADDIQIGGIYTLSPTLTGGTGTLIIGGETAPAAAGVVDAPLISIGTAGDGALIFNHTDTGYIFDADITGGTGGDAFIGAFSGETILTGDNSGFLGEAVIDGGATLVINSVFGGDVFVDAGFLKGVGSVANLEINSILAPGNSIGTIHAATATFNPGSVYAVEVDASGASDLLSVSGAVTIDGGEVAVLAAPGTYGDVTHYTIIQGASVTGGFDDLSIVSGFAFLDPSLTYTADEVVLTLERNDVGFPALGETDNAQGAAGAAEALGRGNPLYDAIVASDAAAAQHAFAQLSGEVHSALQNGGAGNWLNFFRYLQNRLMLVSEAPELVQFASLDGGAAMGRRERAFWTEAFGSWGEVGDDGNATGIDFTRGGAAFGVDGPIGETGRLGASLAYTTTNLDQSALDASGETRALDLAIYGGIKIGHVAVRGAVGHGWRDIETERTISIVSEHLTADYESSATYVQGEIGIPIQLGGGTLEPFLGASFVQTDTDGFTEDGGASALTADGTTEDVTYSTLGLRWATPVTRGGRFYGEAAWRHASGDLAPRSTMAFASNPGVAFTAAGAPIAEDALALQLGADIDLGRNVTLTAGYRGELADDASEHGVSARVSWKF